MAKHTENHAVANRRPVSIEVRQGRLTLSRTLREAGGEIHYWIGSPQDYRGPGVDPAVLGYLIALVYGHGEALAELRAAMVAAGRPGLIDDLGGHDLVAIIRRVCGPGEGL